MSSAREDPEYGPSSHTRTGPRYRGTAMSTLLVIAGI